MYDLLEPSNVNIELTRVIDRPHEEYVGEERIVHVLFAHGRFHSILKLADATRLNLSGLTTTLLDGDVFVLIAQPADTAFLFGPIGWCGLQLAHITQDSLVLSEQDSGFTYHVLTAQEVEQQESLISKQNSTQSVARSAPEDVTFDGVNAKRYKALYFTGDAPAQKYFLGSEVTYENKDGVLSDILCGKALTSSHHVALITSADGDNRFAPLRAKGLVKVKVPLRMVSPADMKLLTQRDILPLVRIFFKDNLAKALAHRPPPVPSTGVKRKASAASRAGPTRNDTSTSEKEEVCCECGTSPSLVSFLFLLKLGDLGFNKRCADHCCRHRRIQV